MQPDDLNSSRDLFNKTSFTTEIRCALTHSHLCWWVDDFKSLSGNEQVNIGSGLLLAFRHLSEKQNIRTKWKELYDFSKLKNSSRERNLAWPWWKGVSSSRFAVKPHVVMWFLSFTLLSFLSMLGAEHVWLISEAWKLESCGMAICHPSSLLI